MKKLLGLLALSLLSTNTMAWNTETVESVYKGCGVIEGVGEVCINVPVLQVGTGNGSSHKAYIVAQGTGGYFKINGETPESGKLYCNTHSGSNGTLLVKASTAHKSGGGTWGVVGKSATLTCEGKDAVPFQVRPKPLY